MTDADLVAAAAEFIRSRLDGRSIDVLVTLGSGLAGVADALSDPVVIAVGDIPGMARSTVPGHTSVLRVGTLGGRTVLAQVGRIHLYEGHSPAEVARMVEVAHTLGAQDYLVTNAAGGIDPSFVPGDVMAITDQLNLTGRSPHTAVLRDGAPVFQDMASAYSPELIAIASGVAISSGFEIRQGIYAGLVGPAFETPAEVGMLRGFGANAVGMSTVLEVIAARARGMRVLGLSTITNVHGEGVATSHHEVLEVGAQMSERVTSLVVGTLAGMASTAID